jgi:pyruvate dehydrogenase E2 component (dihydrolipoamide acetyltransferase)
MTRIRLSPMQRMTINALRRGHEGRVPVTLTAEARAERLLEVARASGVTITTAIAHAHVATLRDHPAMNATLADGEHLERHDDVHLGVAVALDDGALVVPVVHRAQLSSLAELSDRIARLAARARDRTLTPADLAGATFTLSSTGNVALPVLGTPTLTSGQAGILLAARVTEKPVVEDGRLLPGRLLPLSLTFDHLTVNGVPALRFLDGLVRSIESTEVPRAA